MRQVRLGQTDLQVSRIAFGTWAFGGDWGASDLQDSKDSIHRALELGINLFDTAQGYGSGVSNYDVDQIAALGRYGRVDTLQPPYHLFRREIEDKVLPYTAEHDIGVLIYGPLAHGLLAGRMTPSTTFEPDDWRSKSPDFSGETFRRNLAVVERLKGFARERDVSLPELAVAWTLAHPGVHVAIVGARRPSQLDGTAPAADLELTGSDLHQIEAIFADAVPVRGPHPEDR